MEIAAVGTLNACYVDMKEIFKLAIINNSAFIACLQKLTERLQRAGAILGISVIDHIIVGDTDYYSFRDGGELDEE